jgi:hypothetical protein
MPYCTTVSLKVESFSPRVPVPEYIVYALEPVKILFIQNQRPWSGSPIGVEEKHNR